MGCWITISSTESDRNRRWWALTMLACSLRKVLFISQSFPVPLLEEYRVPVSRLFSNLVDVPVYVFH